MSDQSSLWQSLASARTPEAWFALISDTLYVYRKSENPSRVTRASWRCRAVSIETATVTTQQLAERVKAIIDDLMAHHKLLSS